MLNKLAASELVLNLDGSVYHLNLLPEDLAEKIILVGDPDRVPKVSKYFETFVTRSGAPTKIIFPAISSDKRFK